MVEFKINHSQRAIMLTQISTNHHAQTLENRKFMLEIVVDGQCAFNGSPTVGHFLFNVKSDLALKTEAVVLIIGYTHMQPGIKEENFFARMSSLNDYYELHGA